LLKAGVNPIARDKRGNFSAAILLASNYDLRSMQLTQYIICHGYFDYTDDVTVDGILDFLKPSGPDNPKREELYKKLAIRILKYHPEFKDNYNTKMIFGGPTPWKDILAFDDKELCNGE